MPAGYADVQLVLVGYQTGFTATLILAAQVLQGVSSAIMFSQVLAIIQVLFDAKSRRRRARRLRDPIGLGTILGPVAEAHTIVERWAS